MLEYNEKESNKLEKLLTYYDELKNIDVNILGLEKVDIQVAKKITFILTRYCNKNCAHCLAKLTKNKEKFDIENFENILKQLKESGVESIILTGGEVFSLFEYFGEIFSIVEKLGLKIETIKTNLYRADEKDYISKFLAYTKGKEDMFIHGIEPSFDNFHGKEDIDKLKKVIDINFEIIKNPSFEQKKFMNIAIARINFNLDLKKVLQIYDFIEKEYKNVRLVKNDLKTYLKNKEDILKYIQNNISSDYFLFEFENNNGKKLKLRIGLNDIYKIGKAEKISSNLIEKDISTAEVYDLKRYEEIQIQGIDIEGNIYTDEFSTYTGRGSLGNILEKKLDKIIDEKSKDIVLYELQKYGLKRLLPKLMVLYPELKSFQYVIYDDIWQKILTLPEIKKVLHILSIWLNLPYKKSK